MTATLRRLAKDPRVRFAVASLALSAATLIVLAEWVLPLRWRSWLGDALISPASASLIALAGAGIALIGVSRTVREAQRSSQDTARWDRLEWTLDLMRSPGLEGSLDRAMGLESLLALFQQLEADEDHDMRRDKGIMLAAQRVYAIDVLQPPSGGEGP